MKIYTLTRATRVFVADAQTDSEHNCRVCLYIKIHKLSGPRRTTESYGCMRKLLECLSFGNGKEVFENKGLLYGFLLLSPSLFPSIFLWQDGRFVLQMPLSDTWVNSAVQSALLG